MIEARLLTELGTGAAVSAVAGAALWAVGARGDRPTVAAFGRQTASWAAVDGLIAAGGWMVASRRRDGEHVDEAARASALRRLLLVNAGLDVSYVVGGVLLARRADRRGDGIAIAVQGAFLLWLDSRHARRFGSAAST